MHCWFHKCSWLYDKTKLFRHLRTQHDLPLPIVKPYSLDNIQQCPVCSDQYDDIQGLFDHLYRGHEIAIEQPALDSVLQEQTFTTKDIEEAALPFWLAKVKLSSWSCSKTILQAMQNTSNAEDMFMHILDTFVSVSNISSKPQIIRRYALQVKDYHQSRRLDFELSFTDLHAAKRRRQSERGEWSGTPERQIAQEESNTAAIILHSTSEDEHSIAIVKKKRHHEYYDTPKNTKQEVSNLKTMLKLTQIESGIAVPRIASEANKKLPSSLGKLLDGSTKSFFSPLLTFDDKMFMTAVGLDAQIHAATDMVLAHAKQLVMTALIGRESWVLVTHFDVFLQNESGIDDCALPSDETFSLFPSAKITTKNEFRSNWKEVIIQWGCLQFLAVGGYYGEQGKSTRNAFLGSALPATCPLSEGDDFTIAIPFFSCSYEQTTRFLRDYSKKSAALPWSFGATEFSRNGFKPCHPLRYDCHISLVNAKPNVASLASMLLSCVAHRKFTKNDLLMVKWTLAKTLHMQASLKASEGMLPQSLESAMNLLKSSNATSPLLRPLEMFVHLERSLGDQSSIDLSFAEKLASAALDIYKNTLVRHIKVANQSTLDKLKKKKSA